MASFKKALEIITVIPGDNQHEYRLKCKWCGAEKPASTDSPIDLAIKMANEHRACKKSFTEVTMQDIKPMVNLDYSMIDPRGRDHG